MNDWVNAVYWFCTDFCIKAANLLGMTYEEFNMWLFLLLFPAALFILLSLNLYKYFLKPFFSKRKR